MYIKVYFDIYLKGIFKQEEQLHPDINDAK